MAAPPIYTYDAYIISPGVDLTLTGVGTPNLTASYGDWGGVGEVISLKANCTISISYTNVNYTIGSDNSITVTGTISGCQLARSFVAQSSNTQEVTVWIGGREVFHQFIGTSQAGNWDLIPNASDRNFSVTIPPSNNPQTQWPAAIHYLNHNTGTTNPPDEFYFGLGITNPNPPDYRPGALRDNNGVWLSHNRNGGEAHVLVNGVWREMRTQGAPTEKGNPPSIRKDNSWGNMAKFGRE